MIFLRVVKGEKPKKRENEKRKLIAPKKEVPKEDLREVTKSNFNLLRRKLSVNAVRKVWWVYFTGEHRYKNKIIFMALLGLYNWYGITMNKS